MPQYFDGSGQPYEGGPIHECVGCGAPVYDGVHSGRAYNAGGRPNRLNRHTCEPPLLNDQDIPFEEPEEGGQLPATWNRELSLPEGFAWYANPTGALGTAVVSTDPLRQNYAEEVAAFRAWAEEQNLTASPRSVWDRWIGTVVYVRRPVFFNLVPEGGTVDSVIPFEEPFECVLCGNEHPGYTAHCPEHNVSIGCNACGMDRTIPGRSEFYADGLTVICNQCAHVCDADECEAFIGNDRRFCADHSQFASCGHCGRFMEVLNDVPEDDLPWRANVGGYDALCNSCQESRCGRCERIVDDTTYSSEVEQYVCRRCFVEISYGQNEESFDEEAKLTSRKLRIPTIPGRENVRTCGVEIEGANGTGNGGTLARAFYEADLSSAVDMAGYHHGSGLGFAHVESDSSVDWEAVIGPFNPAKQGDVTKLNRAVHTIRGMVKDGTLGLDLRAGLHIHVGAERVSLDGAFNLNTLFAYLEDVIFRLGAARWPIHRAVTNTHYTQPIPKDLRKLEFAQTHNGEESEGARYYALSFNNYFRQMLRHCHCGAVRYDSWEDCTCDLGKCTFEFRVFNTTANPRKLHAYLALTQALVAKALLMGKIVEPATHFPHLSFEPQRFKDMDEGRQEDLRDAWQERLAWMFTELPLTEAEKESLIYCIRYSELEAIGEENISGLLPQETEEVEEVLA